MATATSIERDARYSMPTFARYPLSFVSGSGAILRDEEGIEYLDLLAGIAVNSLGHAHPELAKVYAEQGAKLVHISNLYHNPERIDLEEKLVSASGQDMKVFLSNSGAEANECAIKLARRWADKQGRSGDIVTLKRSFHGRTLATTAATGNALKAALYEPVMPGFKHIEANNIAELEAAFNEPVIAFMAELILGEAGVYELDQDFLKRALELCKEKGALLIIDEVQTGIARTGSLYAHKLFDIEPDIFTLGKALGNGFPIAATLAKKEIASAFEPGDHGTTMGGNPLGSAIALRVLELMDELDLCARAEALGTFLVTQLAELEGIANIRGKGLMRGFSLAPELGISSKELANQLMTEHHILVNAPNDKDIRLLPPLIVSETEITRFIEALKTCIRKDLDE